MPVQPRTDRIDDLLRRTRQQIVLVVVGEAAHETGERKDESGCDQEVVGRPPEDREWRRPGAVRRLVKQNLVEDNLERPRLCDACDRIDDGKAHPCHELSATFAYVVA